MRLASWRLSFIGIWSISRLLLEVFIVSSLLLFTPHSLGLFCLLCIHLISTHLSMITCLIQLLSWFLTGSLLHLTLQETTQHILFLLNPYHLLFLLLRNSLLKSLYLFPLKLTPLHLSFFLTDPRLILIDILQLILVLHKVVIVLLIDGVLLRFDLIANHHLLIIFFLLSLFLLSLFLSHLLALSEDLHRSPLLLLHLLFPPHLILLHCPAVVLMHRPLLLHISPSFVFTPSPTLFAEL